MTAVVDASIAVEYLLRTELGERAAYLLEQETLVAPELLDVEVMAVLRRAVLKSEITTTRANEALNDLFAWGIERISHSVLWLSAWRLHKNVTAYDSFYVATALLFSAPLITADGPLTRAPNLGIVIQNLRY
ncbi:MAG: type II toxin-antitoxin system VapC family toxin [Deltaproteobacteria bacterium]|nr:type II toxin-antitoxin system VapC family toxin [Deltaproteobacteria bacterium]